MPKSKRWSNEKEDVIQIKATICNVLTITNENECKDLLLIKDRMAIKPGRNKTKRYTISNPKNTPKVEFHCDISIEFHLTLSLEVFWHTPHRCIHISLFHILLQVRLWMNPTPLSICIDENLTDDFLHHQFGAIYGKC